MTTMTMAIMNLEKNVFFSAQKLFTLNLAINYFCTYCRILPVNFFSRYLIIFTSFVGSIQFWTYTPALNGQYDLVKSHTETWIQFKSHSEGDDAN